MDEGTVEYWKEKYDDLNMQYDEFQKHSYEFENELETQLRQAEGQINELQTRNNRLSIDNETIKNKLNELNTSTHKQISQLQEELAKFKAVKDEMQKYIRELEQKNDNLEQTNRCAMFSLGEFESKMNEALEKNAILQIEMEEKDDLAEAVQRLRDETRDLKQELAVRQQKANSSMNASSRFQSMEAPTLPAEGALEQVKTEPSLSTPSQQQITLNTILNELNLHQQQQLQQIKPSLLNGINTSFSNFSASQLQQHQPHPVTSSTRINALNLVSDALRKVTSMESRLVATRSLMKESNRDRRSATISTIETSSFNDATTNAALLNTKSTKKATNIVATSNATVNVY